MMQAELYKEYQAKVVSALSKNLGYKNVFQVPKVHKVVVNTCIPAQGADLKQALEDAKKELAVITGQKPAETKSKKSISNFKLRKGQAIGAKVTLPRIRDFRGISPKAFDGHGNYTLGVQDQSIFPEVDLDKIKRNVGFDITIVTTANTNEEAKALLTELGIPFSDKKQPTKASPQENN
jgi:large subunit ribosomal protein L5